MATTATAGNEPEQVECPMEGCGYTGPPASVEAHVSRKTDEAHQGEVGRAYRDRFEEGPDLELENRSGGSDDLLDLSRNEDYDPARMLVLTTGLLVAIVVVTVVLSRQSTASESEEEDVEASSDGEGLIEA